MDILRDKVEEAQYAELSGKELYDLLTQKEGSESTVIIQDYNVNARQLLSVLGATNGSIFLDALETVSAVNSAVKWTLTFLKADSGINVGDMETRNSLDRLSLAGVLASADVDTVKALAEVSVSWATTNSVSVSPARIQKIRGEI